MYSDYDIWNWEIIRAGTGSKQEISISVIHTQLSKNGRRNNCLTFAKLTRINGDVEMYLVGDAD